MDEEGYCRYEAITTSVDGRSKEGSSRTRYKSVLVNRPNSFPWRFQGLLHEYVRPLVRYPLLCLALIYSERQKIKKTNI